MGGQRTAEMHIFVVLQQEFILYHRPVFITLFVFYKSDNLLVHLRSRSRDCVDSVMFFANRGKGRRPD